MKTPSTHALIIAMSVFSVLYAAPVPAAGGCMQEKASISIRFKGVEKDADQVKATLDAKVAEIRALLKEAKLDNYEMQSMNYNISPRNYGSMSASFQFNSNMGFQVQPADRATALMAELIKKGYQASVNVNAYRNGNMPCPEAEKK